MIWLLNNWRICLGIALFTIYSAFIWHLAGVGPNAKLDAIKVAGKAQQVAVGKINQQQDINREVIDREVNAQLKAATDVAVANYRKRYPVRLCNLPASTLPGETSRKQSDDGAVKESVAAGSDRHPDGDSLQTGRVPEIISDDFIRACGEDVAKLNAWQHYAILNQIPIR